MAKIAQNGHFCFISHRNTLPDHNKLQIHVPKNIEPKICRNPNGTEKYPRLFVFSVDNMRNLHFKDVREKWAKHSTFFMGKNRVMALALGRDESEEYSEKVRISEVNYNFMLNFSNYSFTEFQN